MDRIARFFKKLGTVLRRERFSSELEEEMSFHREQKEKELREAGQAPDAAHHTAAREFGNSTRLKEKSYEVMGFRFETVWQDLHFALRQLRRAPGFTVTAVLMLALGIGASVAIFAFVDAALLKPLPYREPTRLAAVTEAVQLFGRANLSYPDYLDWKRMNHVFTSLDIYGGGGGLLSLSSGTVPVSNLRVSDGFFRTLGLTPILGRPFYTGQALPGASNTVILSYTAWQKWFQGRPDAIGKKVVLDEIPETVVGVLPASFDFAPRGGTEFWLPYHAKGSCDLRRSCHGLEGIARLKDGVTMQGALAEMKNIAAELERQYPDSNRGQGAAVDPLSEII